MVKKGTLLFLKSRCQSRQAPGSQQHPPLAHHLSLPLCHPGCHLLQMSWRLLNIQRKCMFDIF